MTSVLKVGVVLTAALTLSNLIGPEQARAQSGRGDTGTIELAGSTSVPFRSSGNHIYVKVVLGGKPFGFIFDTGNAATLEPSVQKLLGFPIVSKQASDSGQDVEVVRVPRLQVGSAAYLDGSFPVMRGPGGLDTPFGVPFGGVIGQEFLRSLVTTIDYDHSRLIFARPSSFHIDPRAVSLDLTMRMGFFPNVRGSVDGRGGMFDIDSGAGQALVLSKAFADSFGGSADFRNRLDVVIGVMMSGPIVGSAVRPQSFSLGRYTVKNPTALIAPSVGMYGDPGLAGTIGGAMLRRFTVTLDVPDSKAYFAPNSLFRTPFAFNRSGISSIRADEGERVLSVAARSPAAEAGIKPGDVIVVLDNRKVSTISHDRFVETWLGAPGTAVTLTVIRASRRIRSTLRLRTLL